MPDVHRAAEQLLKIIPAPVGTVGTLVASDSAGPYIRVFVDPTYWLHVPSLPSTFDGFRVSVEKREPTKAFAPFLTDGAGPTGDHFPSLYRR
jgi:hypothetical protein